MVGHAPEQDHETAYRMVATTGKVPPGSRADVLSKMKPQLVEAESVIPRTHGVPGPSQANDVGPRPHTTSAGEATTVTVVAPAETDFDRSLH